MEKGERLSFSSISVVDELPTSKVLKNFNCHCSVQGIPDCVFWNCQVERKGIRQNEKGSGTFGSFVLLGGGRQTLSSSRSQSPAVYY